MKQKSFILVGYALFLLIGGLIGYFKANSLPSLIASSFFTLLLFICAYLFSKENSKAYLPTFFLLSVILSFFGYRFFLSYKFFPAGIMSLLTLGVLISLSKSYLFPSSTSQSKKIDHPGS